MSTQNPSSIHLNIGSKNNKRFVTHERPFLKPCWESLINLFVQKLHNLITNNCPKNPTNLTCQTHRSTICCYTSLSWFEYWTLQSLGTVSSLKTFLNAFLLKKLAQIQCARNKTHKSQKIVPNSPSILKKKQPNCKLTYSKEYQYGRSRISLN